MNDHPAGAPDPDVGPATDVDEPEVVGFADPVPYPDIGSGGSTPVTPSGGVSIPPSSSASTAIVKTVSGMGGLGFTVSAPKVKVEGKGTIPR